MAKCFPLFIFAFIFLASADRGKIYSPIDTRHFCFRRLNATHEIGCQSAANPVGILILVRTQSDVDFITNRGPHPPYVPIVPVANLSTQLLLQFKSVSHRIAGVIVLRHPPSAPNAPTHESKLLFDDTVPSIYSPETSCPNSKFSLYPESECRTPWVEANAALEMMSYSYPFQMILLTQQNDTNRVVNCFLQFNFEASSSTIKTSWPLCAAEITSLMNAAVNTPTCITRSRGGLLSFTDTRFCEPLSSRNILASTVPLDKSVKENSTEVIVLVARIDSFSMFDDIAPGAYSSVPGILGLMSVAEYVSRIIRTLQHEPSKRILFALLDGEAFGYIGSSALVYDITHNDLGQRPNVTSMAFSNIHSVIELNQIASYNGKSDIWLHTDPRSASDVTKSILESLEKHASKVNLTFRRSSKGLPPSSLMSFLKVNATLPAVHISNHEATYITPYFNSFLDGAPSESEWREQFVTHIAKVSKAVSLALLELLDVQAPADTGPDVDQLQELAECLLFNSSCSMFPEPIHEPLSLYISVDINRKRHLPWRTVVFNLFNVLAKWIANVRSDLTDQESCLDQKRGFFMWSNDTCLESYIFTSSALSPAFILDELNSTSYSTWTESYWAVPSARIFLLTSPWSQWLTFISGFVLVIATWLVVTYLERNHSTLFV